MIRGAILLAIAGGLLGACGASTAGPGGSSAPIAGATLRCVGDYPDSRLVFGGDGTMSGRYAGQDVTGIWSSAAPDAVDMLIRAGAIEVHDTVRRGPSGWRSERTACG